MTPLPTAGITRPGAASRYAEPRTGADPRPPTPRRRARVRTAVAAPHDPYYGSGAATADAIAIAIEEPVTDADQLDPNVPTRMIEGQLCTNRAGIGHLAGWPPGNNAHHRSRTDPDFPKPLGPKIGREYWYPMNGKHGVDTYIATLAKRAAAKKPPPVKPGAPDDVLHGEEAADALHITYATLRSYVRYSVAYWTGETDGRPLLPPPDVEEERENERLGPYIYRAWYRRTLAEHQEQRPGPGKPPALHGSQTT
jgi:hypothetical protein